MIQAATRSRQRGVQFTPRQLFQNQTVARLAAVAGISGLEVSAQERGDFVGDLDYFQESGLSPEALDNVLAELSE